MRKRQDDVRKGNGEEVDGVDRPGQPTTEEEQPLHRGQGAEEGDDICRLALSGLGRAREVRDCVQ
jgi:hypothetical protein